MECRHTLFLINYFFDKKVKFSFDIFDIADYLTFHVHVHIVNLLLNNKIENIDFASYLQL